MNKSNGQLSPAEIESEYNALLNGQQITQGRIQHFEEKYAMSTIEFLKRFAEDEFQHSFDFDEWIGESRMLNHIEEKLARLKSLSHSD